MKENASRSRKDRSVRAVRKRNYTRIGIVTFPILEAGVVPLRNLVEILHHFSDDLTVITGNAGIVLTKEYRSIRVYLIAHKTGANIFTRALNYVYTQLKISFTLATRGRSIKVWFFFLGGPGLLLPVIVARLLRRKVVLTFAGSDVQSIAAQSSILAQPIGLLSTLNCCLSTRIIVYSERLVEEYKLKKHRGKIFIASEHFIDLDTFKPKKPLGQRNNIIGYIGRLSEEKGVLNLFEAIPNVVEKMNNVRFLIGGDGQLRGRIKQSLSSDNLSTKVKFVGWIPHSKLPDYLNEMKLLVLPSYTEGLPNIMLEAMACSTPVLATPVGAIPDVIKDGETGLIMGNSSPESIAANIIRALNHPNLEQIAQQACALVEKKYTYQSAVERYRSIIDNLS